MTASKNENKLNVCKHEQQTKSGGWEGQEVGEGGVGAVAPFTILAFNAHCISSDFHFL